MRDAVVVGPNGRWLTSRVSAGAFQVKSPLTPVVRLDDA